MLGILLNTVIYQQKPRLSRLLVIQISLCMLMYDISVFSMTGIVNELLTLSPTAIGIVRHDRASKKN